MTEINFELLYFIERNELGPLQKGAFCKDPELMGKKSLAYD